MLIWDYWPGREGGAQRQCRKLSRALANRGLKIMVLTQRTRWWGRKTVLDQDIPIVRLGRLAPLAAIAIWIHQFKIGRSKTDPVRSRAIPASGRQGGITTPFWWLARWSFMSAVQNYVKKNHRDLSLIHVHESNWIAGFASRVGKDIGLPVLCKAATLPCLTPMGPDVPSRRDLLKRRLLIRFIALNDAMAAELRAAGVAADRIHRIPNGVEIPSEHASAKDNHDVLFIANFTQEVHLKAYDVLLRAWSLVHQHDQTARLVMVGNGDHSPWRKLAQDLDCGDSVIFPGFTATPDGFYRQAAVFVLPSRKEGMSNALLEAQSWGIPAVVSAIPGNTAIVDDGLNGLVVPVEDAEALAKAIMRLLGNPEFRTKIGDQARQRMRKDFSIEAVSWQISELYMKMAAAGKKN